MHKDGQTAKHDEATLFGIIQKRLEMNIILKRMFYFAFISLIFLSTLEQRRTCLVPYFIASFIW